MTYKQIDKHKKKQNDSQTEIEKQIEMYQQKWGWRKKKEEGGRYKQVTITVHFFDVFTHETADGATDISTIQSKYVTFTLKVT